MYPAAALQPGDYVPSGRAAAPSLDGASRAPDASQFAAFVDAATAMGDTSATSMTSASSGGRFWGVGLPDFSSDNFRVLARNNRTTQPPAASTVGIASLPFVWWFLGMVPKGGGVGGVSDCLLWAERGRVKYAGLHYGWWGGGHEKISRDNPQFLIATYTCRRRGHEDCHLLSFANV